VRAEALDHWSSYRVEFHEPTSKRAGILDVRVVSSRVKITRWAASVTTALRTAGQIQTLAWN